MNPQMDEIGPYQKYVIKILEKWGQMDDFTSF